MHTQELLEYSVPSRITRYFRDYTAVPEWGGVLQRVVDNCEAMGGRKGAEYGASMMASRMREPEVLVNINNKAVFISSERKNNKPTITKLDELDNYEERLNDLSYKMLLPPHWAATWIRQEPEGSILHTVGQKQEDRRRLPTVSAAPQAKITSNGDIDSGGEEISVATNDGGEIIGQVDLPKFGTTGPAATFADSGKQGIANNPEEEEAILEIQTFLSDTLGLDVGRNGPDKIYGPRTVKAVKILQQAINKIGDNSIKVDGDAGPMTISGMLAINQDFEKIAKLTKELDSNKTESFVKIVYKSRIAQLLEQTLIEAPRGELETLIAKYKDLLDSNILPDDAPIKAIVKNAEAKMVALDTVTTLGPAEVELVDGPYKEGDAITNDIADKLETLGIDPAMGGEPMTLEDANALNKGIADGTIEGPETVSKPATTNTATNKTFNSTYDAYKADNLKDGDIITINGIEAEVKDGLDGQQFFVHPGTLTPYDQTKPEVVDNAEAEAEEKRLADELAAKLAAAKLADEKEKAKIAAQMQSTNKQLARDQGVRLHDILDSGILGYTNKVKQQEIIRIILSIKTKELYQVADAAFKNADAKNAAILDRLKHELWTTKPAFDHVRSLSISESINDSVIHNLARLNTVLGVKQ